MHNQEETIAAVATPPGEGGVAIIRISGKGAVDVAAQVFSGPVPTFRSHTAHYGRILNRAKEVVDDVLLLPMLGPKSYTGEDTVEIHCHGGSIVTRRVLEVVLEAGARAAQPGEFTYRAFLNGKLDLAQAEAVQELICAKNEHALQAAEGQLRGSLSQKIRGFQAGLTDSAAILEAWVDFPEEGLEFATLEEVSGDIEKVVLLMEKLRDTFHNGKILHDGIAMCLVGCPNVGKSSLMNALLDKDRAIVSPIAGTTRDVLEDHLRINGLNFRIMDTAGVRKADEAIEMEGIRRTQKAMEEADLILLVLDASRPLNDEDHDLIGKVLPNKTIVVWNKTDLSHSHRSAIPLPHQVSISALHKTGIEELHQKIDAVIWEKGAPPKDEILITSLRHKEALSNAIDACRQIQQGLHNNVSPEFLSQDMRHALKELGKVIGTDITEDILSAIFSKFCIGK